MSRSLKLVGVCLTVRLGGMAMPVEAVDTPGQIARPNDTRSGR